MKVRKVVANNRRRVFEVHTARGMLPFPYSRAEPTPTPEDRIVRVYPDPEIGNDGFTWELESGAEGTLHLDAVLDYNEDPEFMGGIFAYKLKSIARKLMKETDLSQREIARRLGTSPSQVYRLLDPTADRASLRQLVALIYALGGKVSLGVTLDGRPIKAWNERSTVL